MALTKKRLTEIAEKIRNTSFNAYSAKTKVRVTQASGGPHILLSVKINIDTKDITDRLSAMHYMTSDIINKVRKFYPDKRVTADGDSFAVYANDIHLDYFVWIK